MLGNEFKIRLEMLSDWHIGTGAGIPGSVDELVNKDWQGFPQVPAKTIVGIWRDALERLTIGLDSDNGNKWQSWVETIFGSQPNVDKIPHKKPIPASLRLLPARIAPVLRQRIGDDKRFRQALTFVKVGVRIDENSGTASSDMLRFDEMGRIGTVLESNVEIDWEHFSDEQKEITSALLILSAKLIERIGGKRRRGAGKCSFKVIDGKNAELSIIEARTKLEKYKDKQIPHPIKTKREQINSITPNQSDWQICEYTLTLETPASVVSAVLGNVSETLDFVPGTYLISHFVNNCGQDFFRALQSNNIQISPATIAIQNKRGFPVPKVFAQEKMNKSKTYNRLKDPFDETTPQTKPVREGFVILEDDGAILHNTTPKALLIHNAVEDKFQRPTTDVVGVYSREAIQAGTVLKGEIRFRNLAFDDVSKLKGKVRLGTSKKDDYGWAQLELGTPKQFQAQSSLNSNSNELVVYLGSDVMLGNGKLRQTNSVKDLKIELEKTLGEGTLTSCDELLEEAKGKLKSDPNDEAAKAYIKSRKGLINSIVQVRRIESWQTNWGFPRPSLTTMQAGSVVIFEIQNFDNFTEHEKTSFENQLKEIEKNRIGERRGEGYGQIIFNPKILETEQPDWQEGKLTKPAYSSGESDIEDKDFAGTVEVIAWREELKIAVSKIAADKKLRREIFGFEIENKDARAVSVPPMAQIGGLRSNVMRLQRTEDKQLVLKWLERLKRRSNRIARWDKGKSVERGKALVNEKLIPLFDDTDKVWEILFKEDEYGNQYFKPLKDLNLGTNLKTAFWAEAVKSLFYACQQAHKRDTEPKKEDENNDAEN